MYLMDYESMTDSLLTCYDFEKKKKDNLGAKTPFDDKTPHPLVHCYDF